MGSEGLLAGRDVLPKTDTHRRARLLDFGRWLQDFSEYTLDVLIAENSCDPEVVNRLLVNFGQFLSGLGALTVIFLSSLMPWQPPGLPFAGSWLEHGTLRITGWLWSRISTILHFLDSYCLLWLQRAWSEAGPEKLGFSP